MLCQDLFEGHNALIYHTMSFEKAIDVLASDTMAARWEHDIPGYRRATGNSFTRSPRLFWSGPVHLTCDRDRLAQSNRIIPLDGEYVFANTLNPFRSKLRDRTMTAPHQALAEEFVIGPIKTLHRSIVKITILRECFQQLRQPYQKVELVKSCRAYAKKWSVELSYDDPKIMQDVISIVKYWKYDE